MLFTANLASAAVIADLAQDYTEVGAIAGTTTFVNVNGWGLYEDAITPSALVFQTDLGGVASTLTPDGFGGTQALNTALVSDERVFDGASPAPGPGQLTFHPGDQAGAAGDLVIRWVADQDYDLLRFGYQLERQSALGGAIGFALRLNNNAFVIDNPSVTNATPLDSYYDFVGVSSGDYIEALVYNAGTFNADQTYGNFTVETVPEPSSALLLLLGSLVTLRRNRR